jgi:hypothetical protein
MLISYRYLYKKQNISVTLPLFIHASFRKERIPGNCSLSFGSRRQELDMDMDGSCYRTFQDIFGVHLQHTCKT